MVLDAPDPVSYARGHAAFEARSDQRERVVAWLGDRLAGRADAARLSVLSVGCGDGSVDRALAARACTEAPPGALRSWTGLDPHAASLRTYAAALESLPAPGLVVHAHRGTFDELHTEELFDVVLLVHSLYYVADLDAALAQAVDLLAPGGELLVVHAPHGMLNQLVSEVAPPVAGHPQPWSDAVAAALAAMPVRVECEELAATVDLAGCAEQDPALLDFTVQAVLDAPTRRWVLDRLHAIAEPGDGLRVAHPVTAFAARPTGGSPALRSRP